MTAETIITTSYLGVCDDVCYSWHKRWEALGVLTKFGDRSDWKWRSTPAFAIWSSHLLLASHVSISFSLLLSNIWFKAAMSCSEKAQTVATRLWQKTMSLRSWGSLSVIRGNRGTVLRNGIANKTDSLSIYMFSSLNSLHVKNVNLSSINKQVHFRKFAF